MKKINMVQLICAGGLLTALTVLLQSAPVFIPTIGMALSPFSTLPIAIAAIWSVFLGFGVMISSALVLFFISPQEAMILLFTTGIFGVVLGTLLFRQRLIVTILASTVVLTLGILALTYVIAMPAFADLASSVSFPLIALFITVFSLIYSVIWTLIIRKLKSSYMKIKLFQ